MKINQTKAIAFAGLSAALAVLFVFAASLTATSYLALTALAGCALSPLMAKYGIKYGFFAYLAAAGVCFLIIPDKYITFLFISFFGLYPSVKFWIEKIAKKLYISVAFKLIVFNAIFAVDAYLVKALFETDVFRTFAVALVILGANVIFICYDIAYSRLTGELLRRFGKFI